MTEQTAAPEPKKVEIMSMEEINALQQKILENEAAKERNEPPPHTITTEMMKSAVFSLRAQRGTVKSPSKGKEKKGAVTSINVDDLMA